MSKNLAQDLRYYEKMFLIRTVETTLSTLFANNEIPGFIHLSIGQEAIAAGISEAIEKGDTFSVTHRGHGHALANGIDLQTFLAEIMSKKTGMCKGRSGSMHVADLSIGMLGANGIVGGGIPLTVGSALAHRNKKNGNLSVAFFGDGAMAEGIIHESMNIASLWKLPVMFVCENNGWSEFSRATDQLSFSLVKLAEAYGIEAIKIDGNDVDLVAKTAKKMAANVRKGKGPCVIECMTTRHKGHYEGDPQRYRGEEELGADIGNDPLERLKKKIKNPKELDAIENKVKALVNDALAVVRTHEAESFSEAEQQVYAL